MSTLLDTACPTCLHGKVKPNSPNVISVCNYADDEDTRRILPHNMYTKYTVCDECYEAESNA